MPSSLISNMNSVETTFSSLDTFYTPMGHELDCEDMCKICVDENTFNGVYKAYEKTVGSKSKVKVEDLDENADVEGDADVHVKKMYV